MHADPVLNAFTVRRLCQSIGLTGDEMAAHWRAHALKFDWTLHDDEKMYELRKQARRQGMDMELWDKNSSIMDPSGQAQFTTLEVIVRTVVKMHTLNWSSVDPIDILPVTVYYNGKYDFRWNMEEDYPVPEYVIDREN